jgi:hypothetical protein
MPALAHQLTGPVNAAQFHDETADQSSFVYVTRCLGSESLRRSHCSVALAGTRYLRAAVRLAIHPAHTFHG